MMILNWKRPLDLHGLCKNCQQFEGKNMSHLHERTVTHLYLRFFYIHVNVHIYIHTNGIFLLVDENNIMSDHY